MMHGRKNIKKRFLMFKFLTN